MCFSCFHNYRVTVVCFTRVYSKQEDLEKLKDDSQDSEEDAAIQPQLPVVPSGNESPSQSIASTASNAADKKKEKTNPTPRKKFEWSEVVK